LGVFFENLRYLDEGLRELSAPIDKLISDIYHSKVFRILYFIPFAILKLIRTTINWYYENFMTNELMLQTPAQIVLYVYLIPAAVIIGLIILLSLDDSRGWELLSASPVIFALFPVYAVYWICCIVSKLKNFFDKRLQKHKEGITYERQN